MGAAIGAYDSGLSDAEYDARTRAVLAAIDAQIDRWLQDDVVDIDGARTGGLLELTLPDRSKLVINTQPPLHEIWLAARRGGFHFRHANGRWLDTKSGEMVDYLLPRTTNIRRVYVDNTTNPVTFWVGSNHGASIVKLEPLD